MSKLKDLVPSLDLCKMIPAGEFADSVFAWWQCTPFEEWQVVVRSSLTTIPAPTLQEIMAELPACDCYRFSDKNEWTVLLVNGPVDDGAKSDRPATAALKLWLKLKGVDV